MGGDRIKLQYVALADVGWNFARRSARMAGVRVAGAVVYGLLGLGADVMQPGLPYKVRPNASLQPPVSLPA